MSKSIQVEVSLCIDEHGNYQVVGSSRAKDKMKQTALVEDGIKLEGVNTITTNVKFNVNLPEPTPMEPVKEDNKPDES